MSAPTEHTGLLRIGEVALLVATTPRTIRYYEEIGLLSAAGGRSSGAHRLYDEADVDRLRELLRLKELLGVSLEELKALVEAEGARRAEWVEGTSVPRRREIVDEALAGVARQLAMVRTRRSELEALEEELCAKRRRLRGRRRDLGGDPV